MKEDSGQAGGSRSKRQGELSLPSSLRALKRLEVGPVEVHPDRLKCPHSILAADGSEARTELIFKYDHKVFDPEDPHDRNLADMMAAQIAINYGLFCEEIHFRGAYNHADRQFIKRAMENTAREIYVKKLLQPNSFLVGEAVGLVPTACEKYSKASLHFESEFSESASPWRVSSGKYSILSSGGKDSLLSYGLLRELGAEVHPVFGNESGRHWFTALNAFRHFKETVPNTTRVWLNSDRVFSWMLRHFPFIRRDFADVRADDYPLRLWTVAVFLFAALPVLRKRRIGRLVIGDEFDTTRKSSFKGISHFDGLYDQSLFFDRFMTRYFRSKGWEVEQFSLLRPLSELLIQKILARRYPDLFARQVSCHAAHEEDGKIKPCGKCEKCRRIVCMLRAVDCDPRLCGYSSAQIEGALREFARKGIHQEEAGAQHTAWLLEQRNLLPVEDPSSPRPRPHPEIVSVRFDDLRAPLDLLPEELREPLYRIWLQHAEGAVCRQGRKWDRFDAFSPEALSVPYYSASVRGGTQSPAEQKAEGERAYLLGPLTWPLAKKRFAEVDIALLPVGAIEQHGPHLPLDTDAFDAEYLAGEVARRCTQPKPLVLPLIPYGVSYHHDDFSGTISITNDTLAQLVYEIGLSAVRNGIKKLVIVNGHGGNDPALNLAAQKINRDTHIFTCVESGQTSDPDIYRMVDTPNDVHAGEIETSTTLAVRPHLVRLEKARKFIPRFSSGYLNFTSQRGVAWYAYTRKISPDGTMGDPTKASEEKGRKIWEFMVEHLMALVEDLKGLTLDEIFQKRY